MIYIVPPFIVFLAGDCSVAAALSQIGHKTTQRQRGTLRTTTRVLQF